MPVVDVTFTGAAIDALEKLDTAIVKALYDASREAANKSHATAVTPDHVFQALKDIAKPESLDRIALALEGAS